MVSLRQAGRFGDTRRRVTWPLLIACLSGLRYVVARCEPRQDDRNFGTGRVRAMEVSGDTYPGRRAMLIKGREAATVKRQVCA